MRQSVAPRCNPDSSIVVGGKKTRIASDAADRQDVLWDPLLNSKKTMVYRQDPDILTYVLGDCRNPAVVQAGRIRAPDLPEPTAFIDQQLLVQPEPNRSAMILKQSRHLLPL